MAFYIYRVEPRLFLADDEQSWTDDLHRAAAFATRQLAEQIAQRQLGAEHDAHILDDGIE
jgi:hypothetical protein